ncbi:hypothetical protein CKO_01355 [Citrobacter koseri ATCC BAA-895]|uniref:Uncharacterized protein n=1 Tax=Citrobacter koseri (strain ATCC BAA-895 / CDC 4225-83 / SGSC4696) TaxID=290338 RepID=A8AG79_CITK8|nr:hypothetical protein CKO_01355 [Citrobacter koseri ATCC BAA-895]
MAGGIPRLCAVLGCDCAGYLASVGVSHGFAGTSATLNASTSAS